MKTFPEAISFLYPTAEAGLILTEIERLAVRYEALTRSGRARGWNAQDALLITYGDSIVKEGERPLVTLDRFLSGPAGRAFTFVHLLPFYPFTSDDGFAVTDFRAVNPALGDWPDVTRLAERFRLVFDAVINHVSASGVYMQGYCKGEPAFLNFFIDLPPETDTSSVLRTRNLPLLHPFETGEGKKWLWTTFGPDQVDLNWSNPRVFVEVLDVLLYYASCGASMLRLDAIPYLWKVLGTSCAHLPQTHAAIRALRLAFDRIAPHVLFLTETNAPHADNLPYFGNAGDEAQMIYNFTLPPLILHALHTGDAARLSAWAATVRYAGPRATFLNITATHDGIGMRSTEGLLSAAERNGLTDLAVAHGGAVTGKRNADGSVSPYELNINYFDALNRPDSGEPLELQMDRFMLSQCIPLSFLGIPGVYIHSLLGSRNWTEGVRQTGRSRTINREPLDYDALSAALADPSSLRARVLARVLRLLGLRAAEPAFHPDSEQEVLDLGPALFALRRGPHGSGEQILAIHNMTKQPVEAALPYKGVFEDRISGQKHLEGRVTLSPYQVLWLKRES